MTANKHVEIQLDSFDAETEATTWSIADRDCIVYQLEREINAITWIDQMRFKNEFTIHLIQFNAL